MPRIITEGNALINASEETKISKKLPVFYNPVMKLNRDISILLLNTISKKNMQIGLPLAGSGIRGIRFLQELKKNKIKTLYINDYKEDFFDVIKANFSLNKLPSNIDVEVSNEEANLFMMNSSGFDYIDIDPFGTPNPFLDIASRRIARDGIFAVTATDTSSLCGTYETACKRKYWAKPIRNELKHETGIRILIRKVQLVAAQYDKALTPVFSYSKDHYFRVFFQCEKGKSKVDKIIRKHEFYETAGPLWTGQLFDKKLVKKILKEADDETRKFLSIINEELDIVGFYDIHAICEKLKIQVPKYESLMEKIKKKGYKVSRTHFNPFGIKSDISREEIMEIIKNI
ncbi:tRNA (guanine(26)-N(2))-dimethyltransferase [Bacteroidota bacterium]